MVRVLFTGNSIRAGQERQSEEKHPSHLIFNGEGGSSGCTFSHEFGAHHVSLAESGLDDFSGIASYIGSSDEAVVQISQATYQSVVNAICSAPVIVSKNLMKDGLKTCLSSVLDVKKGLSLAGKSPVAAAGESFVCMQD